jgi:ribosomal protein S20
MDEQQVIESLKSQLRQAIKRVPDRINGASVQAVREYKEAYKKATKLVDKKGAKEIELRSALTAVQ